MKRAISTVMISIAVLCAVMMLFGFLSADWFLKFMSTPEAIYADSKMYMETIDLFSWTIVVIIISLVIEKTVISGIQNRIVSHQNEVNVNG